MKLFNLAWRNILRNRRRSLLTLAAVVVASVAILLLGGYVRATIRALETDTVRNVGHLQVMAKGYLQFGRANPGRYAIRDHESIVATLQADPDLARMANIITPVLHVQGVAGHFASGTSSNFSGSGWDPTARAGMMEWNGNGLSVSAATSPLNASNPGAGVIGVGLAQLLGLCEALAAPDCVSVPPATADPSAPAMGDDLLRLTQHSGSAPDLRTTPAIELLSAGAGGAPNVVRMELLQTHRQNSRDFDAVYAGMPLPLAQRLVFGADGTGASAIVVQLKQGADLEPARARLTALLKDRPEALEVNDFHLIQPSFDQLVAMFNGLFGFVSVLMVVVTLFSVANTINMAVGERTGEIGTLRAMGMKRRHVRSMFLIEGALIGTLGAVAGLVAAVAFSEYLTKLSGWTWTPPGRSSPVPVSVDVLGDPSAMLNVVALFAILACISSWWPARRASKLEIVEALRHA